MVLCYGKPRKLVEDSFPCQKSLAFKIWASYVSNVFGGKNGRKILFLMKKAKANKKSDFILSSEKSYRMLRGSISSHIYSAIPGAQIIFSCSGEKFKYGLKMIYL